MFQGKDSFISLKLCIFCVCVRECAHLDQVRSGPAEIKCLSSKTAGVRLLKDLTTGEKFHHRQRTKIPGGETGDGDKAVRRRGKAKASRLS